MVSGAAIAVLALVIGVATYGRMATSRGYTPSWLWQSTLPQGNTINGLSFATSDIGWAVGNSGVILKTFDGGANWSFLNGGGPAGATPNDGGTYRDWRGVSFPSATTGWIVGTQGTAKKTTDGGSSWATQTVSAASTLRAVAAYDSQHAIIVGDASGGSATIRSTSDGTTWSTGATTVNVSLRGVAMPTPTLAWAVGDAGTMLRSADGGQSWVATTPPTAQGLNAVAFARGTAIGYAVGNANGAALTAFKTTDGVSWRALSLPAIGQDLLAVACDSTGAHVNVTGLNGTVLRSDDGGVTWRSETPQRIGTAAIRTVALPTADRVNLGADFGAMPFSRDRGAHWMGDRQKAPRTINAVVTAGGTSYAVGSGGVFMRSTDNGVTWAGKTLGSALNLRGVAFYSATGGAVVGDGGVIMTTTDGGITWTTRASGTTASFNAVAFFNATYGAAVGNGGLVRTTSDAGLTWVVPNNVQTTANLYDVAFGPAATQNDVWAVGAGGTILTPNASGLTKVWQVKVSGVTSTLRSVSAVDANNVMAVGDFGTALRSTNGGTAWLPMTSAIGTSENLRTVRMYRASSTSPVYAWAGGTHGFVANTANGGLTWAAQVAGLPSIAEDTPVTINGAWPADSTHVVMVGTDGEVRTTSDGGTTWSYFTYGTFADLRGVTMPAPDQAWAVGSAGTIINSFDGGQSWYQQASGAAQDLNAVKMVTTSNGYAVGAAGQIRSTTSGGWSWIAQPSGTTAQLLAVDATGTYAIATGANGTVIRTANSGATTWTAAATVPTTQSVTGVSMVSTSAAWACASAGGPASSATIMKTADGGVTWSAQRTGGASLNAITMRPGGAIGWAVGAGGLVLRTADGGATWTSQGSGTSIDLYSVSFSTDTTGAITGANGTILRTTDGGATWTADDSGTDSHSLLDVNMSGSFQGLAVGTGGAVLSARDSRIPITTLFADPSAPDGDNGWYVTPPQITLVSNKSGSTKYEWTPPDGSFSTYANPITAPTGITRLDYYSVDDFGITEPAQSTTFQVDPAAPTAPTALAVSGTPGTASAALTWTASTDPGTSASGVAGYLIFVNGQFFQSSLTAGATLTGLPRPNTAYSVYVVAVDLAGNRSAASNAVTVTTTGGATDPLGTSIVFNPPAPNGANGWYVTTPVITLAPTPSTIPGQPYYSFGTTATPVASATVTPPAGTNALWYWSLATDGSQASRSIMYLLTTVSVDPVVPNAPASLVASATGPNAIHLSWPAAVDNTFSGIDHYDVFMGGTYVASVASPTVFFDVIGLAQGQSYSFNVRSTSSAGTTSPLSATATTSTLAPARPTPPAIVYARGTDGDTVYVNWTPSAGAQLPSTYIVSRLNGGTWTDIATITDPNQFAYVDTGLSSDTPYSYRVSLIDPRGTSDPSAVATAVTGAPTRPRGLVASASTQTVPAGIMLTWQPSTNPATTGYYVYRSRVSAADPATSTPSDSLLVTITPTPVTTPFFLDSTVQSSLLYYYRVAAVDAAGNVGNLSIDVMATLPKPTVPAALNPHGNPTTPDECAACHRTHTAPSPSLIVMPHEATPTAFTPPTMGPDLRATWDNQRLCLSCHNGTAGADVQTALDDPLTAPPSGSRHGSVTSSPTVSGNLFCGSCHGSHRSAPPTDNPFYLESNLVTGGNAYCYTCHGPATTIDSGDVSFFEGSVHNTITQTSPAGIKCDVCHAATTSTNRHLLNYGTYMVCVQCHSGAGTADAPDIFSLLTASTEPTSHLPITTRDQLTTGARVSCTNCHNSMRVTAANPLVDPAAPFTTPWTGDQLSFCFRCHNGHFPTAAQTEPFVAAPLGSGGTTLSLDVQSAYQTNVHGFATATDGLANLRPEMGYTTGITLQCSACHDGHGTVNTYALKQDVRSLDGTKVRSGLLVARVPGGGADFRFFCSSCHIITPAGHAAAAASKGMTVDISTFPTNCMGSGCHQHTMAPLGPATTVTNTTF